MPLSDVKPHEWATAQELARATGAIKVTKIVGKNEKLIADNPTIAIVPNVRPNIVRPDGVVEEASDFEGLVLPPHPAIVKGCILTGPNIPDLVVDKSTILLNVHRLELNQKSRAT